MLIRHLKCNSGCRDFWGGNGNGHRFCNSKMAEAMAFKRVLEYSVAQNYHDMIIELDVQSVVTDSTTA